MRLLMIKIQQLRLPYFFQSHYPQTCFAVRPSVLNVINDTTKSKLYLVNRRTGVNNPIKVIAITEQGIGFSIPASIDTGYYTLWLQSGLYTVDAPVRYRVIFGTGLKVPDNAVTGIYVYTRMIFPGTGTNSISLSATGKRFTVTL